MITLLIQVPWLRCADGRGSTWSGVGVGVGERAVGAYRGDGGDDDA